MKTKVMEVITYKKQTSKTKYIIETILEYRPPLNISRNFFFQKKKSRGFYSRKYGSCFFSIYREYCPRSSHRPRKIVRYLDLGQYFLVRIKKSSYYCIKCELLPVPEFACWQNTMCYNEKV